jgi:hypothetical protein
MIEIFKREDVVSGKYGLVLSVGLTLWFDEARIKTDHVVLRIGGETINNYPTDSYNSGVLLGDHAEKFKKLWAGVE